MTVVQKTVNAYQDVFPIFALRVDCPEPLSFQGTGFLIPPGVFVTCWHCVEKPLEENQVCAVGLKQSGGEYKMACILSPKARVLPSTLRKPPNRSSADISRVTLLTIVCWSGVRD